jgi:hypothetical protein
MAARIDHDFGQNWRLMTGYRYYRFTQFTNNQVDIGGILPGDTFGAPSAKTTKPQTPSYIVVGLSGVITPHLINDLHFYVVEMPAYEVSGNLVAGLSRAGHG